jgi:predicted transcriptional regulator
MELSKQQEAVLTRAQTEGGTCRSTTAYAALVELGSTLTESNEGSILDSVGSTMQSLVELGLMVQSGPGEYHLTEEGFRVAQSGGGRYPFA